MRCKYKALLSPLICCCTIVAIFWLQLWLRAEYLKHYTADVHALKGSVHTAHSSLVEEPVRGGRNVILIETLCAAGANASDGVPGLHLNQRQACTVESAAMMNPDATVYLLYTCPINGQLGESSTYVTELFTYPNVRIWQLDIPSFLRDTPLRDWDFREHLGASNWPVEHASDVLRFVSLWKYGGTYLDLDVLVLKSLQDLQTDFVVKESNDFLASCVLRFGIEGIGQAITEKCVNEILTNFRGDRWTHNGPNLVSRVLKEVCDTTKIPEMSAERCQGLEVLSEQHFVPLQYLKWRRMFVSTDYIRTLDGMKHSYGVHLWNSLSRHVPLVLNSKTPYELLAHNFCPLVFSHISDHF
ncbi:lactosylceramide 4-alpha-galactosyltransferase-like [Periplaneta americana]|uniref:lactosylceramide 4-alpha-galactosyltransferase-like n=1 Tax=Periplaneta americana TaxID=6978 RepID=UPI0037E9BD06